MPDYCDKCNEKKGFPRRWTPAILCEDCNRAGLESTMDMMEYRKEDLCDLD